MSPSRGGAAVEPTERQVHDTVDRSSGSALATARRNLRFLVNPGDGHDAPARLRTRAFLRSLRYLGVFLFWRLVRYAKYAAVGAIAAAVGATAFGSVASGAAFLFAPPTFAAGAGAGLLWAVGRWGFRKAAARTRKVHERETRTGKVSPVPEPVFLGDTFT